jgi:hypothetical protein
MRRTSPYFLPSSFELWCIGLCTSALLIAGNTKLFLQHYGLLGSSQVVGQQLSNRFSSGLSLLDTFSFTPDVVTFIAWAIAGLLIFSFAQAFKRASANVALAEQLGTDRYVHPQEFNRKQYWRHVAIDTSISLGLLVLTGIAAVLYILLVVPVGFMYVQDFLLTLHLNEMIHLSLGIFVTYVGGLGLYLLAKATLRHYQKTAL